MGSDAFSGDVIRTTFTLLVLVTTMTACSASDGSQDTTTSTGGTTAAADVPEALPVPPGIVDRDDLTLTDEDVHLQWETDLAVSEVVAFYDRELPANGWSVTSRREGGDSTRLAIDGNGWTGAVTILGGDPVKVVVQLGRTT